MTLSPADDPIDFWAACSGLGKGGGATVLALWPAVGGHPGQAPNFDAVLELGCSGSSSRRCSGSVRLLLDGQQAGTGTFESDGVLAGTFFAVPQDVIPLLEQRDRRISVATTATGSKPTPAVRLAQILGEARVTVPRLPHRF